MRTTKKRIVGTLAGGAVAVGTFVGAGMPAEATTAPADAAPSGTYQTFKNQAHGGCMDDKGDTLWQRKCSSAKAQKWDVMKGMDHVSLYNADTHDCLNDKGKKGLGTRYCAGGKEQYFEVLRWNDGTISFKSKKTGECVDVDSDGDIGTRKCDKSKSQSWY